VSRASFLSLLLVSLGLLLGLPGCSAHPVQSEQGLAKRIGQQAIVEGVYESDARGDRVRTSWGSVPVQRKAQASAPPPGAYVQASGLVARGRLSNGTFTPSSADFRGVRPAHDLLLRDAKLERHAPPATQPSTTQPAEAR